jgi:hypothetical protein
MGILKAENREIDNRAMPAAGGKTHGRFQDYWFQDG